MKYEIDYDDESQQLFKSIIKFSNKRLVHEREAYTILDFIGDIGGVFEIIHVTIGLLVFPISQYLFNIKAISKLYYAKTK